MKKQTILITNPTGIHARPASQLTKLATGFKSDIEIKFKDKVVNVKSIMSVLSAGIAKGSEIDLIIVGEDECEAETRLVHFFEEELVD